MARTLTIEMLAQIAAGSVAPILLVELDFSSGFSRVWSGLGDLSWNGYTWSGLGDLGGISPLEETTDFRANGVQLQLSGIPSAYMAIALGEQYQGRSAKIYLGMLDSNGVLVDAPVYLFKGKMDTMLIDEGGETSTISVQVESSAISLKVAKEWRYTHEDQQIDYPGDVGFEYVVGLQDKDLVWKPA